MKKIVILLVLFFGLHSCDKESMFDTQVKSSTITLQFIHHWDGELITSDEFEGFLFYTENGELINIERLRYLLSEIEMDGQSIHHHLVDVGENNGLELTIENVSSGTHSLRFTFGFTDENNTDGVYPDLNSVSFNVPAMMGGGYHYMQFDGKYKDQNNEDANFNYHAIRAVDLTDPDNLILQDTSFEFDAGDFNISSNTSIEIHMNVAEWFKNPHTWDLNKLNTVLMPNFDAQLLMQANGESVFSVGSVISE